MPYKGGVQLLPETQRRPTLGSYTSGNGIFWLGIGIGVAVLVVSAIFSSYATNLESRIDELDGQLQATEDARNKEQEKALLDAQKQSRTMRTLLAGKIYWTQALRNMEQMMQSSVSLVSMEASATKGVIAFRATADSYASVAKQLKAFVQGTGVTDISVKSVQTNTDGTVDFDGELIIDTKAMLNKPIPR